MDMTLDPNKKVRMPRTRICYICGRQYGLSSFDIHLKQCKKLWIDRESKKPKHERKPLPRDPMESSGVDAVAVGGGGGGLGSTSGGSGGGNGGMTDAELQQLNDMAQDSYNNAALSKCAYCGRTFLPEKLLIHNKSCTAEKPAKRVGQARLSEDTAPMRPSDSGSFRPSSTTPTPSRHKTPNKQTLPWKSKKMAQTTGGMKRPPASTESNSSRAMTDLLVCESKVCWFVPALVVSTGPLSRDLA
mmetsp:Transcript_17840/g.23504  ORF Transcript_17840/g.23504 Transcript_17840/m.23504 type:complete len:244 (-) Transcript_17840:24-755(-)